LRQFLMDTARGAGRRILRGSALCQLTPAQIVQIVALHLEILFDDLGSADRISVEYDAFAIT
jgi:chromosomal replication initiation ATPase DnaA